MTGVPIRKPEVKPDFEFEELESGRLRVINNGARTVSVSKLFFDYGVTGNRVEQFVGRFQVEYNTYDYWENLQLIVGEAYLQNGQFPRLSVVKGNAHVRYEASCPVIEIIKGNLYLTPQAKVPELVICGGSVILGMDHLAPGVDLGRLRFVGGTVDSRLRVGKDYQAFCESRLGKDEALALGLGYLKHQEALRAAVRSSQLQLEDEPTPSFGLSL